MFADSVTSHEPLRGGRQGERRAAQISENRSGTCEKKNYKKRLQLPLLRKAVGFSRHLLVKVIQTCLTGFDAVYRVVHRAVSALDHILHLELLRTAVQPDGEWR